MSQVFERCWRCSKFITNNDSYYHDEKYDLYIHISCYEAFKKIIKYI